MLTKVSIIIPARNEEKYIAKCLDSIINSGYPKELLTVYVCDGLSIDKTADIVAFYASHFSFIKLLINKDKTTPHALNLGLRADTSDIKIILGAHSEISIDFISNNIRIFNNSGNENLMCVGGIIENIYESNKSEIIGLAMASPFGVGNANFRTGGKDGFVDTVAFGAYKNEIFEKIGYFNEELIRNQDDEFNYRIIKNGYLIYLSKEIKSKYYVRSSFKKLFSQYFQYGYWKVFVNKKHNTITTGRQLVPMLFVIFIILGGIISLMFVKLALIYMIGWILYILIALFYIIKLTKRIKQYHLILYTFLLLHIGYGLGYLKGIVDFVIFKKKPNLKLHKLTR